MSTKLGAIWFDNAAILRKRFLLADAQSIKHVKHANKSEKFWHVKAQS